MSFLCNHLDGEERAGCLTIIVFLILVIVSVVWLFLAVLWVGGLQCVIDVFPDHAFRRKSSFRFYGMAE